MLSLYALFIEAVQHFLPTRYASAEDLAADLAGMILASVIGPYLSRIPLPAIFHRH